MKEPISIKPIRNQFKNYMILYFNFSVLNNYMILYFSVLVLNMDNMILLICSTCTCISYIVFITVRFNHNPTTNLHDENRRNSFF